MKIDRDLEHPSISRCLRTGYPYPIKPVEPVSPVLEVNNEEFAEIVTKRIEKRLNHERC